MNQIALNEVIYIPLELIDPNPYQPRKTFDEDTLQTLAKSIDDFGIMQPISVRKRGDRYELIAGERRLRATKLTHLTSIPAIILETTDEVSTLLALVENLQRENLNFMEEAEGYFNLMHDYGLTQEAVAQKVGKSQSTVANKLRLLNLTREVVYIIMDNKLSERHARALLVLDSPDLQIKALKVIISKELNVKQSEKLIKAIKDGTYDQKKPEFNTKHYLKDIRIFTNTIKQTVDMLSSSGVNVDYHIEQDEDQYQITINIPMNQEKSE